MRVLPCQHRLLHYEEGYCWLESNLPPKDGLPSLIFHSEDNKHPVRCGGALSQVCPWRSWDEPFPAELVPCPHCKRRHRQGSTSQQMCEAWSSAKSVLKEMRKKRPEGACFFPEGTRELPYPEHTSDLVRRLIWKKMKRAVLRRNRHRCQDCGEEFGRKRRKIFDPTLQQGRGGYSWESLEVHHIIPRSEGGSDHPGNLKTLCPSCHMKYTIQQSTERAADRRNSAAFLQALEESGYVGGYVGDPRD